MRAFSPRGTGPRASAVPTPRHPPHTHRGLGGTHSPTCEYSSSDLCKYSHGTDDLMSEVRFGNLRSSEKVRFCCQLSYPKSFHLLSSFPVADKAPGGPWCLPGQYQARCQWPLVEQQEGRPVAACLGRRGGAHTGSRQRALERGQCPCSQPCPPSEGSGSALAAYPQALVPLDLPEE